MNVLVGSVKFVELFRNYECLWRINNPQYSDRNKRLDAMLAIASELIIHFVEVDFVDGT